MAYQHFYSRVPARLSMYEKTDSFDTFAKSEVIDQKFINDNLLPFCNIKLTTNEMNLIRDGKFSTSFAQYLSKNGEKLIQSAISYIPLDFTGERSSYMVHSLIYSEEERMKVVSSNRNGLINSKLFCLNIDTFDITNKESKPITDMDELLISGEKSGPVEEFVTKYPPVVVKRLIYAILQTLLSKGKNVYITLDVSMNKLSETALNFMNTLVQIFPYSIRSKLTFVTFLCDLNRYNNLIKIKFIPKEFLTPQLGKAYQFDMTSKMIDGIRDEEYKSRESEIDFMYDLLGNKSVRDKFLAFYAYVVEQNPKLNTFDMKDFSNIILLFKQSSGEFEEKFVIPEDKDVYNLLCVYEAFREYLKEKDRCEILKCIQRYATNRIIIPQNIFSKVIKLYPTELVKCKTTVMAIILELIHTDVMRDKLFSFIKSNYNKEIQKNRSIISEDLSRVFYGGFLQSQIIGLFSQYYEDETSQTKTIILEKLLLAIRTQGIQEKILEFLDKFYESFTPNQRDMIYNTFYEMLLEDDSLTKKIINFINKHYDLDTSSYKKKIENSIATLVENDEKKKTRFLLDLILSSGGILEKIILHRIFVSWSTRSSFTRYLENLSQLGFNELTDEIIKVWTICYEMPMPAQKRFTEAVINAYKSLKGVKLYSVIDLDDKLLETIKSDDYRKLNDILSLYYDGLDNFYNYIKENYINGFVKDHLLDALNPKLKQDGVEYILDFAQKNPFIKESDTFYLIVITNEVTNSIKEGKNIDAVYRIINTDLTKPVMKSILESLKIGLDEFEARCYTNDDLSLSAITIAGIYTYLETGDADLPSLFDYAYTKRKEYLSVNRNITRGSKDEVNVDSLASIWAFDNICLYIHILKQASNKEEFVEKIYTDEEKGIKSVIYKTLNKLDKDGNKRLVQIISEIKKDDEKLATIIEQTANKYKKENKKGFFSKLFGKK